MNLLKRAILNITRKPLKPISLFIVICLLGTAIGASISYKSNVDKVLREVEESYEITVNLLRYSTDESLQNMMDQLTTDAMSEELENEITGNENVKEYTVLGTGSVSSYELANEGWGVDPTQFTLYSYYLMGCKNGKIVDSTYDNLTLFDGRWLTEDDEENNKFGLVIPINWAEYNDLSVGDTVSLDIAESVVSYDFTHNEKYGDGEAIFYEQIDFTVVGIYDSEGQPYVDQNGVLVENDEGDGNGSIYTTYAATRYIVEKSLEYMGENFTAMASTISPTIHLTMAGRDEADAFLEYLDQADLPEGYQILTNLDDYDATIGVVYNMVDLANNMLAISVAAAILILLLVTILIIHYRKDEIGILFSIGEKKMNIAIQMIAEVVIIAVLGITLSLFIGDKIATNMYNDAATEGVDAVISETEYTSTLDAGTLMIISSEAETGLNLVSIMWIYGVGIFVAIIATVIPLGVYLKSGKISNKLIR